MGRLKKIFNLTNIWTKEGKLKELTLFGHKFCFRIRKSNKIISDFKTHPVADKTVLYIEVNNCHGEVIPGMVKYLSELGYKVDILISANLADIMDFSVLPPKSVNKIYKTDYPTMKAIFQSEKIKEYEYCFLNSSIIYGSPGNYFSFFELFPECKKKKKGFIMLEHHLESLNQTMLTENRVLQLADIKLKDGKSPVFCNSHYYGKISNHTKNNQVNFLSIGTLILARRNPQLLFDGIKSLLERGYTNFKITLVGRSIPFDGISCEILNHIDCKGRISYQDMFEEIKKADFLLTLLDPAIEAHNRYIECGTSGTFQLSYGFEIPCIIPEKFAATHFFNRSNSIIHKDASDFAEALIRCIEMKEAEYDSVKEALKLTAEVIRTKSRENLRNILEEKTSLKNYQQISSASETATLSKVF